MAAMRTTIIVLPTLAAAAMGLGACGGSGPARPGGSAVGGRERALEGALKFARCMRGEGIPVQDPQAKANGAIAIRVGGGPGRGPKLDPRDPRMKAAERKCGRYMRFGGGQAPDAATQAKLHDAFVAYASCMRKAGVNVPDPKAGQAGLVVSSRNGGSSAPNPDSPAFKAADRTCHSHLATVEKTFGKPTP
jgi:hypothetical protein